MGWAAVSGPSDVWSAPTGVTAGNWAKLLEADMFVLTGSLVWNPGSLDDGAGETSGVLLYLVHYWRLCAGICSL